MRNTILKYGLIAGLVMGALMFCTSLLLDKIGYTYGEAIGYACMILGFLPVFLGTRKYRDDINGGNIGFGRAFFISISTALFATLFYVAAWLFIYYNMPDVMAKYTAYTIDQLKAAGKPQKDIDAILQQMQEVKEIYKNPLKNALDAYLRPLSGTIVFSLITALLIRRKPASPLLPQL